MVARKGFVRTLEAVIAVLIILGFVLFLIPEGEEGDSEAPFIVKEAQRFVLEEIALNDTFRGCITGPGVDGLCNHGCLVGVNNFITNNKPSGYAHTCEVCDKSISCSTLSLPVDKSVFTDSVFISADQSKVLRVYFWEL